MFNVVATGSTGNAIIYHETILVDCGVPYALLKPFVKQLKIVLLTHCHGDHINIGTLKRLMFERPTLRIACCEWMVEYVANFRNIDVLEIGQLYDYGQFKVSPVQLYHDVPNCGYRIFKDETKIFHATDTATLEGITAKNYDLYAIESNYDEETVLEVIAQKQLRGEFAYQKGSINSHLSEQQAMDFIFNNKGENSTMIRLHESKQYLC